MATPTSATPDFDPRLLPSGALWLPRASLSACLRGVMVRSTVGAELDDTQRLNHFPATPLCSLSWWFTGCSLMLEPSRPGQMGQPTDPKRALAGPWVFSGPHMRPMSSWCPGPVHGMMAMFLPDALHALTGLEPAQFTDQLVDAATVLPPDWLAMCQQVQEAADDTQRMALLEDFLDARWQQCRPERPMQAHRYGDWVTGLAQRAAVSAPGRSRTVGRALTTRPSPPAPLSTRSGFASGDRPCHTSTRVSGTPDFTRNSNGKSGSLVGVSASP